MTTKDSNSMAADALYSSALLGLAVELARYPLDEQANVRGSARSRTCGSAIDLSVILDPSERIERTGMRVSACAVGQAAAAIFARGAAGRNAADLNRARQSVLTWLEGAGDLPPWPGFDLLEPARPHRGRHAAILLPWNAALDALSRKEKAG